MKSRGIKLGGGVGALLVSVSSFLMVSCLQDRPDWTCTNHRAWQSEHPVQRADAPLGSENGKIPLGILEFDDQGQLWRSKDGSGDNKHDKTELGAVLKEIKKEAAKQPLALVIFVHGWNNNAKDESGNLGSFKDSLRAMDQVMTGKGMKVFGVYVSWRGQSFSVPVGLDYFNRESSAMKIGRVEATAALQALSTAAKTNADSKVISIGHSLGGVILLRSVAQPMASRIADLAMSPDVGGEKRLHPLMDTILVVNPADNAILARQLVTVMQDFNLKYQGVDCQDMPLIVSATSKGDWATGWVYSTASAVARYPLGGLMTQASGESSSWGQEWAAVKAVGYSKPIHSHELVPWSGEDGPLPSETMLTAKSGDSLKSEMILKNLRPKLKGRNGMVVWLAEKSDGTGKISPYHLRPLADSRNRTPYWIMQIPTLVSKNHTDIWNANFTGFLTALTAVTVEKKPTVKRPDGTVPRESLPGLFSAPKGTLQATTPQ